MSKTIRVCIALFISMLCVHGISTAATANTYFNERFGFSVLLPPSFVWDGESENGDGQKFSSQDKKLEVLVYGRNNVLEESASELFKKAFDSKTGIKSKYVDSLGYKLEGNKDGLGYIEQAYVNEETIVSCFISYPEAQDNEYKSIADSIVKSFKFATHDSNNDQSVPTTLQTNSVSSSVMSKSVPLLHSLENKAKVTASSGAKIRSRPSQKSEKIAVAKLGDEVSIISKSGNQDTIEGSTNYWYKVKHEGIEGWIFGGLIQILESTVQNRRAEIPAPTGSPNSWSDIGVSVDQVESWEKNGFTPVTAREWAQVGISPFESRDWVKESVPPSEVLLWKKFGASPQSFPQHVEKGVTSEILKSFAETGITQISDIEICVELKISPEESKAFRSGKMQISTVSELFSQGLPKAEIRNWVLMGFEGLEILNARKVFPIAEAREWFDSGVDYPRWADWKSSGFTPSEAKKWRSIGYDLLSARESKRLGKTPETVLVTDIPKSQIPAIPSLNKPISPNPGERKSAEAPVIVSRPEKPNDNLPASAPLGQALPKPDEKKTLIETPIPTSKSEEPNQQLSQNFELYLRKLVQLINDFANAYPYPFAVMVGILAYLFWDKFIRRKCPNCKSTNYVLVSSQEIDRWLGEKTVPVRNGKGEKVGEKSISVTYIKKLFRYSCNVCGTRWEEVEKQELS